MANLIRKYDWKSIAPKLVAFLATGLTASLLIGVGQFFGLTISAELAALVVAGVSSVAAYIQRDNLLSLAPGQISLKVITFIVTGASATGVVALAAQFGLPLDNYAAIIGAGLTLLGAVLGYTKADQVTPAGIETQPVKMETSSTF